MTNRNYKLNKHNKVTQFLDQSSSLKCFLTPVLSLFVAYLSPRDPGEGGLQLISIINKASKSSFCSQRSSKSLSILFVPSGRSTILLYESLDFKSVR